MKNLSFFCFFLIFYTVGFSQEKNIQVKIEANGNNVEGINVVNLVNEKSAKSDANGEFQILAKADDMLVLSSERFEYKRRIITEDDLKSKRIMIKMTPKPGQLEEVVITKYRNINAVDLGILSKPAKEYTPAERRLKTASSYDLTVGTYNSVSLDAIINSISGRTAMLKKELEVERREIAREKLLMNFDEDYFAEKLKIPTDYIKGFQYYAVEDDAFRQVLNSKNKIAQEILLNKLSTDYLKLVSNEN